MEVSLSVEAPKESQPFWNKNAGCMKKYQRLSHENLNQRKSDDSKKEYMCFHLYINNMKRSFISIDIET